MDEENEKPPHVTRWDEDDRAVGYKRPPVQHRFKKGKSGNEAGRPKGSRNKRTGWPVERLEQLFLDEANRVIPVMDNGRMTKVTMLQAGMRSLLTQGIKGDFRSQKFMYTQSQAIESRRQAERHSAFQEAVAARERGYAELLRRKAAGEKDPKIYPHPDDIYIDWRGMNFAIAGPWVAEEKWIWDLYDRRLSDEYDAEEEIKELLEDLAKQELTTEWAQQLREQLKQARMRLRKLQRLTGLLGPEKKAWRLAKLSAKIRAGERLTPPPRQTGIADPGEALA